MVQTSYFILSDTIKKLEHELKASIRHSKVRDRDDIPLHPEAFITGTLPSELASAVANRQARYNTLTRVQVSLEEALENLMRLTDDKIDSRNLIRLQHATAQAEEAAASARRAADNTSDPDAAARLNHSATELNKYIEKAQTNAQQVIHAEQTKLQEAVNQRELTRSPTKPVSRENECAICLDEHATCKFGPCGHKFCAECNQVLGDQVCPICRKTRHGMAEDTSRRGGRKNKKRKRKTKKGKQKSRRRL